MTTLEGNWPGKEGNTLVNLGDTLHPSQQDKHHILPTIHATYSATGKT